MLVLISLLDVVWLVRFALLFLRLGCCLIGYCWFWLCFVFGVLLLLVARLCWLVVGVCFLVFIR